MIRFVLLYKIVMIFSDLINQLHPQVVISCTIHKGCITLTSLWLRSVRFCFFKNLDEIPSFFNKIIRKKIKKNHWISAKFGRFRSFSFTILTQLRVNFAQVRLWFRFNSFDLFKVGLISFNFIYILFWQLYVRKPRSIYVQLRNSAHIYVLSRLLLRLLYRME